MIIASISNYLCKIDLTLISQSRAAADLLSCLTRIVSDPIFSYKIGKHERLG